MNEKQSYTEYNVIVPTQDFIITFEDYNSSARDTINVTVNGVPAVEAGFTVLRISDTVIQLTPAVEAGAVVRLQRETGIDNTFYRFTAGAIFTAGNVDKNFQQILHSQQEVRDGFGKLASDVYPLVGGLETALATASAAAEAADNASAAAIAAASKSKYILKYFDPTYVSGGGSYPIHARLMRTNGEVVISTIPANTHDPNSDMTGWVLDNAARYIFDASGLTQQEINDGFSSIAEMLSVTEPKDGMRVFVKGSQGGWFEYNASKSAINDGVLIFNGWVRITLETGIRPEWAGAPHDGTNDDAAAIRKCVEYCGTHSSKRIQLRNTGVKWVAGSVDANNCAISISTTGIIIDFETGDTEIEATVPMLSILYFRDSVYKFVGRNGTLLCANKASYGIFTLATKYTPQLSLEKMTVTNPIEDCVYLQAFIGDISMITMNGGKRGLVIKPVAGNITTSLNIRSCYARNQTVCGYDIDVACYCALIACAADNMPLAYKLNIRGGAMTACGAEAVDKIAEFVSFRGLSINGLYSQRCGSTDPLNPTPYLLEFVTGTNATLSGLHIEIERNYTYKVGITTSNYGHECLHITDGSVRRSEAYFVPNFAYTRPIKFAYDDATQKDLTVSISNMAEFRSFAALYLTNYELKHKLTVQLANGTYNFGVIVTTLSRLTGNSEVTIQGSASDRSLVKLETEYNRLVVSNCSAGIRFKNLTLSANAGNNANERLIVDNSMRVYLDNIVISKNNVNVGVGVRARNNSTVYITNGTIADSSAFATGVFVKDATSRFIMDAAATAPITLNWSVGMTVANTNPTTHLGWVFSGGAWKTYGAIS